MKYIGPPKTLQVGSRFLKPGDEVEADVAALYPDLFESEEKPKTVVLENGREIQDRRKASDAGSNK